MRGVGFALARRAQSAGLLGGVPPAPGSRASRFAIGRSSSPPVLVQIAVLSWLFLREPLGAWQLLGLALASAGTLVVQLAVRGRVR